jgi:hypothetical protein
LAALSSAGLLGAAALAGTIGLIQASAHTFGTPATTPNTGSAVAGTTQIFDTAHLNEDVTDDRKIRFQLFDNATCTPSALSAFTALVSVPLDDSAVEDNDVDNVSSTPTIAPATPGTYYWVASIMSGNSVETSSGCKDEPVTVTKPATTTTPTPTPTQSTPTPTPTPTPTGGTQGTTTPTPTPTGGTQGITTGGNQTPTGGTQAITTAPTTGTDLSLANGLALLITGGGLAGLGLRFGRRRRNGAE